VARGRAGNPMTGRAAVVWLGLVVLAIVNGAFREALLIPRMGLTLGLAASSLMLSLGILAVTFAVIPWLHPSNPRQALGIGLGWLGATLVFEFGFGHYLRGKSWSELLVDYDVLRGRIWIVVLLTTALAPPIAARVRRTFEGL
jgi:hypothetical protein